MVLDAERFLSSVKDELLDQREFGDVSGISAELALVEAAIQSLDATSGPGDLPAFLKVDGAYELAGYLLATPAQWLRARPVASVCEQLSDWREWLHGASLRDVVVGILLAEAHRTRAQRRRQKFSDLLRAALGEASNELATLGTPVEIDRGVKLAKGRVNRTFDFVVNHRGIPAMAVVGIFQTRSGGRQQELFEALPQLQRALAETGVALLVVADGPGFLSMSSIVRRVAPQLENFVNLSAVADGALRQVLSTGVRSRPEERLNDIGDDALSRTTVLSMRTGNEVTASVLGVGVVEAEEFFLRYLAKYPEYDVERFAGGIRLRPDVRNRVQTANAFFDDVAQGRELFVEPEVLVGAVAEAMGYSYEKVSTSGRDVFALHTTSLRLRLPNPLPLIVTKPRATADAAVTLAEDVEELLSKGPLVSRCAVVIDALDPQRSRDSFGRLASQGKSQVAVFDRTDVIEIVLRTRIAAREHFTRSLLRDVDLSLVSPFVSEGPTPPEMFFGRDQELRRIVERVRDQSFALVGGRKVGKTSMLQRLRQTLGDRMPVHYVDCQAHPSRVDFLEHLTRYSSGRSHVDPLITVARAEQTIREFLNVTFKGEFGVLLLDEVDELFLSDSTETLHPHVLSKALRALSQSRTASLIATGERALYSLTSDPTSPHWNFCTPIRLGPLAKEPARDLLRIPLADLGVEIGPDALTLALDRSACHPNLLQYLGNQIVSALGSSAGSSGSLNVPSTLVESLASTVEYRNRFVLTFWSQAIALEKLLSTMLELESPTSDPELVKALRSQGIEAPPSQVAAALRSLELYSITREIPEGHRLAADAFLRYLKPFGESLIAQQWIAELRGTDN